VDDYHSDSMPPALINKLSREKSASVVALSSGDLVSATAATKAFTQRKLLALSPKILTRMEDLMDGANASVAMTAASKLADLSPALRVDPAGSSALSSDALPAAAIEALMSGLRPFIDALAGRAPHADVSRETLCASDAITIEVTPVTPIPVKRSRRHVGK